MGLNDLVCVYLLRPNVEQEVTQVQMNKQIMFGEIKSNPLHQLSSVLSQVFLYKVFKFSLFDDEMCVQYETSA